MDIYIKVFYISVLIIVPLTIFSQISLSNPSFEGIPGDASMPSGWFQASPGTTPDILPGFWGVYNEPFDGNTFVGLITREDGSFESISQRLDTPLLKDECYEITLRLAHSLTYSDYNSPLYLRIWLGDKKNSRQQLIFKSPLISKEEWSFHKFEFIPEKDMNYIIFEAHISDRGINYKGNILIDDIGTIKFCFRA